MPGGIECNQATRVPRGPRMRTPHTLTGEGRMLVGITVVAGFKIRMPATQRTLGAAERAWARRRRVPNMTRMPQGPPEPAS